MKPELIKLKEAKEYAENPFLESLNVSLVPKSDVFVSKDKNIVNIKTGELDEDVLLTGKRRYVDGEQFVKIFVKEIDAIFNLSKASQKVFTYMLSKVRYDDLLMLDVEECLKKTGYKSRGPIYTSLAELIQKEFIAKTKSQFAYWINPRLFYKGDRLVVMREYRKARKNKIEALNQLSMFNKQADSIRELEARIEERKVKETQEKLAEESN